MSTDFDQLIANIELEARQESPDAVRELAQFRKEFGAASRAILRQREEAARSSAADSPARPRGTIRGTN